MDPLHVEIEKAPLLSIGLPQTLRAMKATLPIRGNLPPNGLRIVHLSDLHLRNHVPPALPWLAKRLAADPPDLILITGDFVDDKVTCDATPTLAKAANLLRPMATLGLFGSIGNHDGDLIAARLEAAGIVPLHGRRVRVENRGFPVELLGLPGTTRYEWPGVSTLSRNPAVPLIVLGHYPDEVRRVLPLRPSLYLAGHTHGGQIAMPKVGPLLTHDGLPKHQSSGIHRFDDTWLSVSRGIGTTRLHARFLSPAEYGDLTLVAADEAQA